MKRNGTKSILVSVRPNLSLVSRWSEWRLVSHVAASPGRLEVAPVSLLKGAEDRIDGLEFIKRAKAASAHFGLHFGEAVLDAQKKIPAEWRPFTFPLPGSIYRANISDGSQAVPTDYMPCLSWYVRSWVLVLQRVRVRAFDGEMRLLVARRD